MERRLSITPKLAEKILESPTVREARLWCEVGGGKVQCLTCERRCVIPEYAVGFCSCRANIGGILYVLTYGDVSSISNNPMEKKPFYHFFPGEFALTIGSWGCNFTCVWCQNWEISKFPPDPLRPNYLPPDEFVRTMRRIKTSGTSFSFNEPLVSLFEYSLDVMPLAHRHGYFNTYVTNGYMTLEALELLIKHGLDAACVNIKGCNPEIIKWTGGDVEKVWRNVRVMYEKGVHVELVTLVVPGVNDSKKCLRAIAKRIKEWFGDDVPWHVTRYFAAYRAREYGLPDATPVETLEMAYQIGKEVGLKYVYLGNVPFHPWENTYCPSCGALLIERHIYDIYLYVDDVYCPKCGEPLPLVLRTREGKVRDWRVEQGKPSTLKSWML